MELLERGNDMAAIARVLATAGAATGAVLVIEAPAGLGKTALLTYAATVASEAGMRVLSGSGDMMEQDLPWGVVLQCFSAEPDLAAELVAPPAEPVSSNPLPILHRIHGLLAELTTSGPLLLTIDDLHWADPQSLQCLRYLLRRIDELPIAVVVAVRSGEASTEVTAALDGIASLAEGTHRALAPLSDSAIETLARRHAPTASTSTLRAIAQAVGGNPFLCREVATQRGGVIEPHPHGGVRVQADLRRLQLWIRARLGEAGPVALRAAQATSVLGRQATVRHVAAVAGATHVQIAECLDRLHIGGLIDLEHNLIAFRHPILREVVYSATGPTARQELHYRCARLLREQGLVQEAGAHLLTAGARGEPWELPMLRTAAQRDLAAAAADRAVRFLRAALQLCTADDRGQILLELGRAELLAGDTAASEHLREALQTLVDGPARVLQQVGDWLYSCALFTDAAHAYRIGLDQLRPGTDRVDEARLIAGLHSADLFRGARPDRTSATVAAMAADPPVRPDTAERILLAIAAGESTIGLDRPRETVLALARRAVTGDQTDKLGRAVLEPLACAFVFCDELSAAKGLLDDFIAVAAERGEFVANASLKAIRSLCCFRMGDLDQAELDANDVLVLADTHPAARTHLGAGLHALALTHLERNELDAAERALDFDAAALWGDGWLLGLYLDARGRVDLARGRAEQAWAAFVGAGERFTASGGPGGWVDWRGGAALAAQAAGHPDRARAHAREAHQVAVRFGVPTRIASALRTLALIEEDPAARPPLLREAAEQLRDTEATLDHARVLIDLGGAQRRLGRRRDCRAALRRGRDLAQRCGAWALAAHAGNELEASGARRPTLAIAGVEALTPAERRVAGFAVAGRSNREIADLLFLSRKTVETHLGSVYRKLGIAGRAELGGEQWQSLAEGSG